MLSLKRKKKNRKKEKILILMILVIILMILNIVNHRINFHRGFKLQFRIQVAYVVSRDIRQTRVFPWTSPPAHARRALIDHILAFDNSYRCAFIGMARNRRKRRPDFAPPRINLLNKSGRRDKTKAVARPRARTRN